MREKRGSLQYSITITSPFFDTLVLPLLPVLGVGCGIHFVTNPLTTTVPILHARETESLNKKKKKDFKNNTIK